jgi:hypothetical protein
MFFSQIPLPDNGRERQGSRVAFFPSLRIAAASRSLVRSISSAHLSIGSSDVFCRGINKHSWVFGFPTSPWSLDAEWTPTYVCLDAALSTASPTHAVLSFTASSN